ncbi:MAG: tRNA adenosine(34) deaminase TadA [Cyanobacteria bacterium P01_F01_bin.42]
MSISAAEYKQHQHWMAQAIALAQRAGNQGEIPVGAVIVDAHGQCIATGENQRERHHDPTAHAEIVALRQASDKLKRWHLNGCTLYVTLEPCPMCAGAILQARIQTLVYGADDPKTGAIRTVLNLPDHQISFHRLKVRGGICEAACQQQLQHWFQQHLRREK